MVRSFTTHNGDIITGSLLSNALNKVADDWANLAHAIRKENAYASHVSDDQKEAALSKMLKQSEAIRAGEVSSFTIWQRVNTVLTGECVPFLPRV